VNERWNLVAREGLAIPALAADATGKGVRVAVVDTGVNFGHPHLARRPSGASILWRDGELEIDRESFADRRGHGTCCAALIAFLAPDVEMFAVRVTDERATTDADRLAAGIELGIAEGARIISVSMGTRTRLRARLDDVVRAALSAGAVVVAAGPDDEVLPGACPGAIAAHHRDGVDVIREDGRLYAEGRARPAEGFRSNFWGSSLSTARIAAALARTAEQTGLRGEALAERFSNSVEVR
jgi:subtilisin family serine protease